MAGRVNCGLWNPSPYPLNLRIAWMQCDAKIKWDFRKKPPLTFCHSNNIYEQVKLLESSVLPLINCPTAKMHQPYKLGSPTSDKTKIAPHVEVSERIL